jgi:hypothetical protein
MLKAALATGAVLIAFAGSADAGELALFSDRGFHGDRVVVTTDVRNMADLRRWNDRARSLVVESGAWEVCRDARYRGGCVTLRPGEQIADLRDLGLNRSISSAREIDEVALSDRWRGRDAYNRFNDSDSYRRNLSACQARVYDGLVDRFGTRAGARFEGTSSEGRVNFDGRWWRFSCERGDVHVWE